MVFGCAQGQAVYKRNLLVKRKKAASKITLTYDFDQIDTLHAFLLIVVNFPYGLRNLCSKLNKTRDIL